VTLEQAYLYWYGNEQGSVYDEGVRVLPVNIPIGSQIGHAADLKAINKSHSPILVMGELHTVNSMKA